jgi:hypothetical protein
VGLMDSVIGYCCRLEVIPLAIARRKNSAVVVYVRPALKAYFCGVSSAHGMGEFGRLGSRELGGGDKASIESGASCLPTDWRRKGLVWPF